MDVYFKNWSVEQADRYYNQIISEIEFIANNFSSGRSIKHIKEGYRVSRVKSHLIFYKKGSDDIVEIVRVLHQRMDVEKRLSVINPSHIPVPSIARLSIKTF